MNKKIEKLNNGYVAEVFSSVGLVRYKNEDSVYVDKLSSDITLLIVADGMGGGEDGKIASTLAIDCCIKEFNSIKKIDSKTPDEIKEILREIILEANDDILSYVGKERIIKQSN